MNIAPIPAPIARALRHVIEQHPDVTQVTFRTDGPDCGGVWEYSTASGAQPAFGPGVDVSLLEQALDAAWEHRTFPATYTAKELS